MCAGLHGSLLGMEGSVPLTRTWILTSRIVLSRRRKMAPKTQQIYDIKRQLNSWELSPGETELGRCPEATSQSGEPWGSSSRGSPVPVGYREAGHRAGLGFSTKDDSVISPQTQLHSGDICACHHWEGVYWHLGGKARDAVKHPAVRRQPQQQRIIWPQMLMLPRRRGGRQHRGGGHCISYGQGHGEKQEPGSKMIPLTSDHGNTSPNLNRAAFFIWKFGIICKLIPNLGQACTERHSPRLLLASKLAYVSSTLKRLILT